MRSSVGTRSYVPGVPLPTLPISSSSPLLLLSIVLELRTAGVLYPIWPESTEKPSFISRETQHCSASTICATDDVARMNQKKSDDGKDDE